VTAALRPPPQQHLHLQPLLMAAAAACKSCPPGDHQQSAYTHHMLLFRHRCACTVSCRPAPCTCVACHPATLCTQTSWLRWPRTAARPSVQRWRAWLPSPSRTCRRSSCRCAHVLRACIAVEASEVPCPSCSRSWQLLLEHHLSTGFHGHTGCSHTSSF